MKRQDYLHLVKSDLFRYRGRWSWMELLKVYMRYDTFALLFLFRTLQYVKCRWAKLIIGYLYLRKRRQTGIQIPQSSTIGEGLLFCHTSCIVFAENVVCGNYCSIHQGVTIGRIFAGKKSGVPTIGNHVIIFPGAKVVGNIHIGNNVVIGANATVLDDVPDNCVVVGSPARIVSTDSEKSIGKEWWHFFAWDKNLIR